jgi:hypothetical protein
MTVASALQIKFGRMAEGVGFEPTVRFHAQRFSRPSQSTTLPPLHKGYWSGELLHQVAASVKR